MPITGMVVEMPLDLSAASGTPSDDHKTMPLAGTRSPLL